MAKDIVDLANIGMEVSLGGKTLKIRKLGIGELLGFFQAKIRSKRIAEAQELASTLVGGDKVNFMKSVWKDLPSNEELLTLVGQHLASISGIQELIYLSVKKSQQISEQELYDLISGESIEVLGPMVEFISGSSISSDEPKKGAAEKKVSP